MTEATTPRMDDGSKGFFEMEQHQAITFACFRPGVSSRLELEADGQHIHSQRLSVTHSPVLPPFTFAFSHKEFFLATVTA